MQCSSLSYDAHVGWTSFCILVPDFPVLSGKKIDEKIEKKEKERMNVWKKRKKEKYLEEERRTEQQLFRKICMCSALKFVYPPPP